MEIKLDIEQVVADAIKTALAPTVLAEKITNAVNTVVDKAIQSQFSTYGTFSKVVEASVATLVPHELSLDGAASFHHLIKAAVQSRANAFNQHAIDQAISPLLDSVLQEAPTEISLKDVVLKAREMWHDDIFGRDGSSQMTVDVEQSEGSSKGYCQVSMDPKRGTSRYSCKVQLAINPKGEVYGLKYDRKDVEKAMFVGPLFNFERYLFWLYTGKTKIVGLDTYLDGETYYEGSED